MNFDVILYLHAASHDGENHIYNLSTIVPFFNDQFGTIPNGKSISPKDNQHNGTKSYPWGQALFSHHIISNDNLIVVFLNSFLLSSERGNLEKQEKLIITSYHIIKKENLKILF